MTNYGPNHPYNNPNNPGGGPGQYPAQPGGYVPGMSPYSMEAADQGRATNKGVATAGLVLGVISIVWTIVALSTGLLDKILNS